MGKIKELLGWKKTCNVLDLQDKTFKIFGRSELFKFHKGRFWSMNWELLAWRLSSINLFVPKIIWFKEVIKPVTKSAPFNTDDISLSRTKRTFTGMNKYV